MQSDPELDTKIARLRDWLNTNWTRLSDDDENRGYDALTTLQKDDLAEELSRAALPDIAAAVKAINTAIDGIKQESKKLATVGKVVGWIAEAAALIEKAIASGVPL
jgi:hypothetical protein